MQPDRDPSYPAGLPVRDPDLSYADGYRTGFVNAIEFTPRKTGPAFATVLALLLFLFCYGYLLGQKSLEGNGAHHG